METQPLNIPERFNLLRDEDIIAGYTRGWRGEKGQAEFVARPHTTQDVSDLVAWCIQNSIHLTPQSGRTGLVGASVPAKASGQAIISLANLKEKWSLNRMNRSLHCSAGYRLSEINESLLEDELFFPIDLSADPCIGGMIATNTGGSRLLRYGGVRENILGLTVVLGDREGTVLKLGSNWRKHAVGPDWKHLFIGTGAAFGIITECVLSVEPTPKHQATALLALSDAAALCDVLVALEKTFGSLLSACEFMSASALEAAWANAPELRRAFANGDVPTLVLLVELSCDWPLGDEDRSLEAVLTDGLAKIWDEKGNGISDAIFGRPEEFWHTRHALSEGVRALGRLYAFDLSFERQDVFVFREHMIAELAKHYPEIRVCDFGHVGDGGIHFNLIDQIDESEWTSQREISVRDLVIQMAVEEFHGCFSAEHGVGPFNQRYFDRYAPEKHRAFSTALESVTSGRSLGRVHFGEI